jgi:uncharacterized membrane protein YfcA
MLEPFASSLVTAGPLALLLVAVAAVAGGVAQATAGFGAAFVTVPTLALVAPELLPGAMLVAALPLSTLMAYRGWDRLDRPASVRLLLGRLPGIAVGTAIVASAGVRLVTAIVAVVLLVAVAAAATGWQVRITPGREIAAGIVSGVTGTAAALGGPPIALLYRDRDPEVLRPTLGLVWAVGIVITLPGLWATGSFDTTQALAGGLLGLLLLLGLALSRGLVRRLEADRIRAFILVWAGVGGVAALLRVLLG